VIIKTEYQDEAFYGHGYHDTAFSGEIINRRKGTTDELTASETEKYLLEWLGITQKPQTHLGNGLDQEFRKENATV
jgi:hypothetical protein